MAPGAAEPSDHGEDAVEEEEHHGDEEGAEEQRP
jgi:hypothetical protein